MGAINNPVMPNNDSMISKASRSSQAAACILLPTIFALIKYSSLWTATKNNNAAIATLNDTPMPITVMRLLEIKFPITGNKPAKKVTTTKVLL